jgi:hypothetical protein
MTATLPQPIHKPGNPASAGHESRHASALKLLPSGMFRDTHGTLERLAIG